ERIVLLTERADPFPCRRKHLQDHLLRLLLIGQHRGREAQQPWAGELDQLDQRLLVARNQAPPKACFADQGEPAPWARSRGGRPACRRAWWLGRGHRPSNASAAGQTPAG